MGVQVSAATIVEMAEVAYVLRSFRLPFGDAGDDDMQAAFERAVEILVQRTSDRIRRGLYRRQVERVEDLIFVREPTTDGGAFARIFRQDPYLRCSYRSEQAELEDNLILLWTLYAASRTSLGRGAIADRLRHAYRTLAGSLALTAENAEIGIGRFYRRLHEDERPMHGLCRFVLEHLGPEAPDRQRRFRLNRAALFAAYVARWLRDALRQSHAVRVDYEVRYRSGAGLALEVAVIAVDRATATPPLILWPAFHGAAPTGEAIRRAVACIGGERPPVLVLVFPAVPIPLLPMERGTIAVRGAGFDLRKDLGAAGTAFLNEIGCVGA